MMKQTYIVELEMPTGATVEDMRQYIKDAICGGMGLEDPRFHLKRSSVKVKKYVGDLDYAGKQPEENDVIGKIYENYDVSLGQATWHFNMCIEIYNAGYVAGANPLNIAIQIAKKCKLKRR